jgi:hypothetical protein
MDQLKQKANKRITLLLIIAAVLSLSYFIIAKQSLASASMGFITGLYISLLGICVVLISKTALSMRSKEALKTHFIKESDERKILILQKTSRTAMLIYALSLGIATCISFFINDLVFYTLFATMLYMAVVKVALKLFYTLRY